MLGCCRAARIAENREPGTGRTPPSTQLLTADYSGAYSIYCIGWSIGRHSTAMYVLSRSRSFLLRQKQAVKTSLNAQRREVLYVATNDLLDLGAPDSV